MHTFKMLTVSIIAAVVLIAAPAAHAQSQDDLRLMQTFLAIVGDYYEVIESTYDISSNPEKAAILQMQKIQEVYEDRGEKVRSADVLKQVLKETDNATIRNAAYVLLGDTLKDAGRSDEALELLRQGLEENIKAAK